MQVTRRMAPDKGNLTERNSPSGLLEMKILKRSTKPITKRWQKPQKVGYVAVRDHQGHHEQTCAVYLLFAVQRYVNTSSYYDPSVNLVWDQLSKTLVGAHNSCCCSPEIPTLVVLIRPDSSTYAISSIPNNLNRHSASTPIKHIVFL